MIESGSNRHAPAGPLAAPVAPDAHHSLIEWADSFLANAPAPVIIIERAGYRLLYANPAFRRLHFLPTTPHETPVSQLFDLLAARQIEALVDNVASEPTRAHETKITTRTGEPALSSAAWLLTDRDGSGGGEGVVMIELRITTDAEAMLAFQVDMTQRLLLSAIGEQEAAEAARAAERVSALANAAKDRFLTTMSHELRTPLNAIAGYTELIELGLRGPVTETQRHDLGRIQRAQEHLLGLINSVLNFSKLDSGSLRYEMEPVRLVTTLIAVQEMMMPLILRQRLTYRDEITGAPTAEPLVVWADPEKLRQILINLLTNAVKFTAADGTIRVWCATAAETISIHITDTGRGIPEDHLSAVFDPFVQVGRRLNSGDQGVGLGLSISRELARGMGGELTATSRPGVGSTFTLTLHRPSTGAPPSP